ncbi:hypothetical protein NHH03_03470 [Stieleria sp. TO1_6]|nr:hypothetical protein [Stieleria tagensis]
MRFSLPTFFLSSFTALTAVLLCGCKMGVPIHVWSPPALQSTVGKSVMIPDITGPSEVADSIHEKLLQAAPTDSGRATQLLSADDVKRTVDPLAAGGVALVSYDDADQSDLALINTARQQGIDFILRGEILPQRGLSSTDQADQRIAVSWRLLPVQQDGGDQPNGKPVVVNLKSALERYPDLGLAESAEMVLQSAVVRDTLPLITPSVQRERVLLEIPYLTPGSKAIRRGNALALAGRWQEAEAVWREVRDRYAFSSVAVHNLSLAAVANQDFSRARKLASKAVRMKPSKLHQQTLVWVEREQRAYHESFGLPDPPEGWVITRAH